jgi:hypothetical protein
VIFARFSQGAIELPVSAAARLMKSHWSCPAFTKIWPSSTGDRAKSATNNRNRLSFSRWIVPKTCSSCCCCCCYCCCTLGNANACSSRHGCSSYKQLLVQLQVCACHALHALLQLLSADSMSILQLALSCAHLQAGRCRRGRHASWALVS